MPLSNGLSQRMQARLEFRAAAQHAPSIGNDMRFHRTSEDSMQWPLRFGSRNSGMCMISKVPEMAMKAAN
jgi:hypothetical protein